MYKEITDAISSLRSLTEEQSGGINDRLDKVEKELKLFRKDMEVQEWDGETAEMLIEDGKIELDEEEE